MYKDSLFQTNPWSEQAKGICGIWIKIITFSFSSLLTYIFRLLITSVQDKTGNLFHIFIPSHWVSRKQDFLGHGFNYLKFISVGKECNSQYNMRATVGNKVLILKFIMPHKFLPVFNLFTSKHIYVYLPN